MRSSLQTKLNESEKNYTELNERHLQTLKTLKEKIELEKVYKLRLEDSNRQLKQLAQSLTQAKPASEPGEGLPLDSGKVLQLEKDKKQLSEKLDEWARKYLALQQVQGELIGNGCHQTCHYAYDNKLE